MIPPSDSISGFVPALEEAVRRVWPGIREALGLVENAPAPPLATVIRAFIFLSGWQGSKGRAGTLAAHASGLAGVHICDPAILTAAAIAGLQLHMHGWPSVQRFKSTHQSPPHNAIRGPRAPRRNDVALTRSVGCSPSPGRLQTAVERSATQPTSELEIGSSGDE